MSLLLLFLHLVDQQLSGWLEEVNDRLANGRRGMGGTGGLGTTWTPRPGPKPGSRVTFLLPAASREAASARWQVTRSRKELADRLRALGERRGSATLPAGVGEVQG